MGGVPSYPWLYAYSADAPRHGSIVMRPVVAVTLVGSDVSPASLALVDSGSEHVLAAPWLASAAGIDLRRSTKRLQLGIGGDTVDTTFVDLLIRLHPPNGDDDTFVEWGAEIGFVDQWRPTWPVLLGQVGFIDRFTVTMSRQAQILAVEDWDCFDQRFGIPPAR